MKTYVMMINTIVYNKVTFIFNFKMHLSSLSKLFIT